MEAYIKTVGELITQLQKYDPNLPVEVMDRDCIDFDIEDVDQLAETIIEHDLEDPYYRDHNFKVGQLRQAVILNTHRPMI